MQPRRVIGCAVALIGVAVAGVLQGSDWHPDRLRYEAILASYLIAFVGLFLWRPEPTANHRYVEAERGEWPRWRQAVAPVGVTALVAQLGLRVFGADLHHLVIPQIATGSVFALCVAIGAASYARGLWRRGRDRWSDADSGRHTPA